MPKIDPNKSRGQSESEPIVITLPSGLEASQTGNLLVYVINESGNVVETSAFKGQAASLKTSANALEGCRIFIAPKFPAEYPSSKIDVYALIRAGAYQVPIRVTQDNKILIQRLPEKITIPLPIHFCQVPGNVTNTLIVNGVPSSGPVCKARVHICTVEWFYIWPIWLRPIIPPYILTALKDSVVALRNGPVASRRADRGSGTARKSAATLGPLSTELEDKILAATADNIHEILFNNREILFPYFCRWPIFWPWFYRIVQWEVVYTDCNGYFDGEIESVGAPVTENLYIWVEACINGSWVTVYDPPFPCNTYWNYSCGTEIDITLNNPAIAPCSCAVPVTGGTVWFTAIGSAGIAINIQQDETSTSLGLSNVGCTNFNDSNQLAPFGSQLGLYLAFGPSLPPNATHFRWKWTPLLASNMMPVVGATSSVISGPVNRYYLWPTANGWELGSIPLMDTDSALNVAYLIPNYEVTAYGGISSNAEWVSFNFLSASFDTTQVSNGYVIQFDLELLNKNSSGVFETVSVPVGAFQVSNDTNAPAGYDGSMAAPYTSNGSGKNYLTLDPAIPGNALSFSLKVMVDNSQVVANINDACLLDANGNPVIGGTSGPCGFIQFPTPPNSVLLSFVATEPFNRARFSYSLIKGSTGSILGASGYVFNSASPFTLSLGTYSDKPTIASLLGTCNQAAFAESLTVNSLATDGSTALCEIGGPYSASRISAFALTPQ